MNAPSKMVGQPMQMNHPVFLCPAVASIVSKWFVYGRWAGWELQFSNERTTRHLKFAEIRELQKDEEETDGRE